MSAQLRQQVIRYTRIAVFGGLAATSAGRAVASDLHHLAADAHVAFLTPGFWGISLVALAENLTRSVVPVQQTGAKTSAKQGWPARALAFVAQKLAAALAPQPPAA